MVAVLAKTHDIPFYIAAPRSTIDPALPDGNGIPIEQRDPKEVTHLCGKQLAPDGVRALKSCIRRHPAQIYFGNNHRSRSTKKALCQNDSEGPADLIGSYVHVGPGLDHHVAQTFNSCEASGRLESLPHRQHAPLDATWCDSIQGLPSQSVVAERSSSELFETATVSSSLRRHGRRRYRRMLRPQIRGMNGEPVGEPSAVVRMGGAARLCRNSEILQQNPMGPRTSSLFCKEGSRGILKR